MAAYMITVRVGEGNRRVIVVKDKRVAMQTVRLVTKNDLWYPMHELGPQEEDPRPDEDGTYVWILAGDEAEGIIMAEPLLIHDNPKAAASLLYDKVAK